MAARNTYVGCYDPYLTLAEERLGYPQAQRRLQGYDDAQLEREHREMVKGSLCRIFGGNAKRALQLVEDEMQARRENEVA